MTSLVLEAMALASPEGLSPKQIVASVLERRRVRLREKTVAGYLVRLSRSGQAIKIAWGKYRAA